MSALLPLYVQKVHGSHTDSSAIRGRKEETSKWSEAFWFSLSLVLFLAMGPFSAIAVAFGVLSLVPKCDDEGEPLLDAD